MSNWHGGKGSSPRPTDKEKYNENWDRIFGSKKEHTDPKYPIGIDPDWETEEEEEKEPYVYRPS